MMRPPWILLRRCQMEKKKLQQPHSQLLHAQPSQPEDSQTRESRSWRNPPREPLRSTAKLERPLLASMRWAPRASRHSRERQQREQQEEG